MYSTGGMLDQSRIALCMLLMGVFVLSPYATEFSGSGKMHMAESDTPSLPGIGKLLPKKILQ